MKFFGYDMRKIITLMVLSVLSLNAMAVSHGIDPVADSLARKRIMEYMAGIRKTRPTVALVLSGGGAKGAAHAGVIRRLEELDIPVDIVLGTSMGGLVGGLYAIGYDYARLDTLLRNADWKIILSDKIPRSYISYNERKYKEKFVLSIPFYRSKEDYLQKVEQDSRFDSKAETEFKLGADEVEEAFFKDNLIGSLPGGYVNGQNVNNLINSLTVGYQDEMDFLDLPIPFVCVAADVVSGKAKIWYEGKLPTAMRSTMSVPGLFAPVRGDGMVLVDGGIRDNYPTGLARQLGADIIIGVELSDRSKTYEEVNNVADIFSQAISMLGQDNFERNKDGADVKIKPDLHEYNMLSFSTESVDTIIHRGYEAAIACNEQLLAVKDALGRNPAKGEKRAAGVNLAVSAVQIGEVEISGVDDREYEYLVDRIGIKSGDFVKKDDLDDLVALIYSTKCYEYVSYEILGDKAPYRLHINCKRGPVHQLGIGLRLDTEDIVSALIHVGLNSHKLEGSTYDFTARVNANPYFQFRYSYDTPKAPTFNALMYVNWTDLGNFRFVRDRMDMNYLNWRTDIYMSNFKLSRFNTVAGVRNNLFNLQSMGRPEDVSDSYDYETGVLDMVSFFADGRTDTCDDGYFPTKGVDMELFYEWNFSPVAGDRKPFHIAGFNGKFVIPAGRTFAIIPSVNLRCLFGSDIPVVYANMIGGSMAGRYSRQQTPFIGINGITTTKNILSVFRTDFRLRITKNNYITAIVNYMRDTDKISSYLEGKGNFGAGVEYAYDTVFGPISVNLHWSDLTNRVGFYINVGYNF